MSKLKIRCWNCGDEHKADSKHFLRKVIEIVKNKEGKETPVLQGYLCRKCIIKQMLKEAKKDQRKKGIVKIQ